MARVAERLRKKGYDVTISATGSVKRLRKLQTNPNLVGLFAASHGTCRRNKRRALIRRCCMNRVTNALIRLILSQQTIRT